MAANQEVQDKKEKAEKRAEQKKRREGRAEKIAQRQAARQQKMTESGKAQRLCSLATVEVKKGSDGFHVSVSGADGTRSLHIASDRANQVLRDLETAIMVMRSQQ